MNASHVRSNLPYGSPEWYDEIEDRSLEYLKYLMEQREKAKAPPVDPAAQTPTQDETQGR